MVFWQEYEAENEHTAQPWWKEKGERTHLAALDTYGNRGISVPVFD